MNSSASARQLTVWDLPIRLFHWLIVLLLLVSWWSGDRGGLDVSLPLPGGDTLYLSNMDVHMLAGQAVLVLVLFRLLWGLWGSTTARFSSFVRSPLAAARYLREWMCGKSTETVGHNPAGGLMVVCLLGLLFLQSVTGLFANDDMFAEGPLAHLVSGSTSAWLTVVHGWVFDVLLIAIVLHVTAVLLYSARGQGLIRPMLTGRKSVRTTYPQIRPAPAWRAALSLAVAWAAVWLLRTL